MHNRKRPALHVPCLLATSLALTACAGTTVPGEPTVAGSDVFPEGVLRAYVWQCAEGQRIVMRNLLPERAITLGLQDGEHRLGQTVSASGVRYADEGERLVFWTKGETATLERSGAAVRCQERRAESLVEDARLRGVIYRALGNEPGWTLEVGPRAQLDWVTNYGTERLRFTESTVTLSADGRTRVYSAGQGENSIKLTVRPERCVDDGDIAYDHTAVVEFRGATLRGCATRLTAPPQPG